VIRRVVSLVLVAVATAAHAQGKPAPAPQHAPDPVKVHLDQGVALYNDGNYSAALAEFEAAYELAPAPYILNNIGLAQKGLFRYQEAIATLQKFLAASPNLPADQRKQTEKIIAEMQALLSPVTLDIKPAGAQISVDGKPLGAAPVAEPLQVPAGSHTVDVALDGYASVHREITVAAATPLAVSIALTATPKLGTVHVTTVPNGAIAVDGKPIGLGDVRAQLEAGGHTLDVTAPGFQHHREELMLGAGQDRSISIQLDATPHWYGRWYVWGPAAAVVAGIVTTILVVETTHQGPLQGSLGLGKAQ
jgi:PEGA domain/Tetratricopeptide repeat